MIFMIGFRPYEKEIVERFQVWGKARNPVTGASGWKGLWIRGYLQDVREDYVYSIFKEWRDFTERAASSLMKVKMEPGDYQAFRGYFSLLKRLGLVRPTYTEPSEKGGRPRSYYQIVPGRVRDPAWARPYQVIYEGADWTAKSAAEKRALRSRYKKSRVKPPVD